MVRVEEIIRFTRDDAGHAENRVLGLFDPLISKFLRLLPLTEITRRFGSGDQIRWNSNRQQDEASVERLSAAGVDQRFQGAQGDPGTSVNDRHTGFVPTSGILCRSLAVKGYRTFSVFASSNAPGADQVVFHARE